MFHVSDSSVSGLPPLACVVLLRLMVEPATTDAPLRRPSLTGVITVPPDPGVV
jgi:hypothetical protein